MISQGSQMNHGVFYYTQWLNSYGPPNPPPPHPIFFLSSSSVFYFIALYNNALQAF